MLVLSRHRDERIIITVDSHVIIITALGIQCGQQRIGIDADQDVTIHREEVHQAIERGERPGGGKRQ